MNLEKKEYNVEDFYTKGALSTRIATSGWFNHLTLSVILLNVAWIGYDADQNLEDELMDAEIQFIIMEYFFTVFYTFEIIARLLSFGVKRVAFRDTWFCFDGSLVVLMIFENVILPLALSGLEGVNLGFLAVLKLFRLLRLARIVRIVRAIPELVTLIRSMSAAARSVCAVSFLLWGNVYVFAVIFRLTWTSDTVDDDGNVLDEGHGRPGLFDNMANAIFTLVEGTLSAEYPGGIRSYLMKTFYLAHLVITNTLILHMLVGLMCEIVTTVGGAQRDKQAITDARSVLRSHFDSVDVNGNNLIDIFEFFSLLQLPEVIIALQDMDIDVIHWIGAADYLFEDTEEITFAKFLEVALSLRSNNFARVSDIVDVRKLVCAEMIDLEARMTGFEENVIIKFDELESQLGSICKSLDSL
jgi:voltage-gated sodium channel